MKKYIRSSQLVSIEAMARNKVNDVTSCAVPYVVYSIYLACNGSGRVMKVSGNNPGKLLIISGTTAHPNHDVTFQLTPHDVNQITIEVVEDNFLVTQDVAIAINTILNY